MTPSKGADETAGATLGITVGCAVPPPLERGELEGTTVGLGTLMMIVSNTLGASVVCLTGAEGLLVGIPVG